MFGEDFRLPEGGVLLHIGPHKTGTTAIQGALRTARPQLPAHGVVYAGATRQHQMAALAITGGAGLSGYRAPRQDDWDKLVRAVDEAPDQRVIVSSEFFDDATDEVARQVVEGLGGDRVHVVVTLRPLAKIMPSAWQQYVRNRSRVAYHDWLDIMLNHPENTKITVTFWKRHRHDVLVQRWASIVGPERLLVVVVDESDRTRLLRTFEHLVDLPTGLLEEERTNRSLTAPETELIRAINMEFYDHKWPAKLYNDLVRDGIVRKMQERPSAPDAPRITTPAWAVEKANEIATAAMERIAASGVRVLGDLSMLTNVAPEPPERQVSIDDAVLPLDGAADAVIGALNAYVIEEAAHAPKPKPALPPVRRGPARVFAGRVKRRLKRSLARRR